MGSISPHQVHAVILNPECNGGAGAEKWKAFLSSSEAVELGVCEAPMFSANGALDPETLIQWCAIQIASGRRNFLAAGGDGTVHGALNALLRLKRRGEERASDVRLGAIGLGSSNDFQKPYDATGRKRIGRLQSRVDFLGAKPHDVGVLKVESAPERFFIINASIGVTAEANWAFSHAGPGLSWLKRRTVNGAICAVAARTLLRFKNLVVEISADGRPFRQLRLSNLGIVKNVHFAGEMKYDVPQACDDGGLGFHLCERMGRARLARMFVALSQGRFSGFPGTVSDQVQRVDVRPTSELAVETDGEVERVSGSFSFFVHPREILVCP